MIIAHIKATAQGITKMKIKTLITIGMLFGVSNAFALPIPPDLAIDFRDAAWAPADGQHTYTVDDVTVEVAPDETFVDFGFFVLRFNGVQPV